MNKTILLTSFQPWLAHHRSNASDDLLAHIKLMIPQGEINGYRLDSLRKLPVDGVLASQQVLHRLRTTQPQITVCCGMAERYQYLTIEQQAVQGETCLQTNIDLDRVKSGLRWTKVSNDAGKFVCEHLYFNVLNYTYHHQINYGCIFIHVPILKDDNAQQIFSDFCRMLRNLTIMYDQDLRRAY